MATDDTTEIPTEYSAKDTETRWYEFWEQNGYFTASDAPGDDRETYTIAIPPPNVTGSLHMGHACRTTFEDLLIRYNRMLGKNTLWIPGTDHAGIATQVVVERILAREGKTRHDLGREKFVERVWQWKEESGGRIMRQLRSMGATCDWSREHFTMDETLSAAVREAFVKLYEEGLIYRGTRLVNWDVKTRTVLSDLEVDSVEIDNGELFDFAYPIEGEHGKAGDGEVVVSTTRPETMLGDTAVAVHPDDERYTHLHGKFVINPFNARRIPIICDAELVDMEFGTGVVKVTPAHDPNDFATGKRHGLEEINILNLDGTLNEEGGPFAGLERFEARRQVKAKLDELGLARGSKKHKMTKPISQRSGEVVEPMISTQWFMKMEPLAAPAITAVEDGSVEILPPEWKKTYFHWMRNIQDWCISRQLWWGHAIPAWYCDDCDHVTVLREDPATCGGCGGANITRDEDVLDTWFSSALWPFSTLGWPKKTVDLERFYPTQDMETGYDILFFWVARMIMMGIHFMGEPPFSRVLLAGIVTDEKGDKMSKTKGNVIDPIDVIRSAPLSKLIADTAAIPDEKNRARRVAYLEKAFPEGLKEHGADALRMTLLSYPPQAHRIALSIERINGYKNFANKLWNASRFALMNLSDDAIASGTPPDAKLLANRWVMSRLSETIAKANAGIESYRLDEAASALYHFVWDELCDWYLEISKPLFESTDAAVLAETNATLVHVLETTLRALHPLMPFITEDIWQRIPKKDATESIIIAPYPIAGRDARSDADADARLVPLQAFVGAVRTIRAEHQVHWKVPIEVHYAATDALTKDVLKTEAALIERLCNGTLKEVDSALLDDADANFKLAAVIALPDVRAAIPNVIDPEKERDRLARAIKKVDKDLGALEKKLANPRFVDNAPEAVVAKSKEQRDHLAKQKEQLSQALGRL